MAKNKIQILLIDDDDIDIEATRRHVQKEGLPYELHTAGSEAEALSKLHEGYFDVVLLDYDLGTATGFDILPHVGETPAIFVTGSGTEEIAVEALRKGACDYLIKDPDRNYLTVLPLTITNVLERRKAETALAESQRELKSIIRTVPDIIYRLDPGGRVTFISDAVKRYGYEPEALLGHSMMDLVHPGDKEKAAFRINERRTGDRSTRAFELRLLTKSKKSIPFEIFTVSSEGVYCSDNPRTGAFEGTQGIAKDITDRRRVEEEREQLIQELQNALTEVKILSGLLPICSYCKKVRDDDGYWQQIDRYIESRSEAKFSHGMCNDCMEEHHPKIYARLKKKGKI
ncbi:MAG: PAS domain S-box protein [Proteobacteria bacterium]|nr:PAS domain S-box protein [Pseudomonadota bacterium]